LTGKGLSECYYKTDSGEKKAGISSTSPIRIVAAQNELYAAVITGDNYYLTLKLGKNWGWQPGNGWTLETSGERYAVWSAPVSK